MPLLRIARPTKQLDRFVTMNGRCAFHSSGKRRSRQQSKDRVLLLDDIQLAYNDLQRLDRFASVSRSKATCRDEFLEEINDVKPRAIYRHAGAARSVTVTGAFDATLIRELPTSLQFLSHNGAGYDQVDVDALTHKGVQLANLPNVVDDATSTAALWLLIGTLRHFRLAMQHLHGGLFNSQFPFSHAFDAGPRDAKILGIVGAGGIGQALARKASTALGMQIIYHNRRRLSEHEERDMTKGNANAGPAVYVERLDDLLRQSDAVSLHCPITPDTYHLIGERQLTLMKSSAVLINTARGKVVNEEALANALHRGTIAGVGLDVFEHEPNVHPVLQNHPRALTLPHVGTLSSGTQCEGERVCLENILHGLQTGKMVFVVPEQQGRF